MPQKSQISSKQEERNIVLYSENGKKKSELRLILYQVHGQKVILNQFNTCKRPKHMFYESQYRQLLKLRTEYWRHTSPSLRNLKLSQMVLCADACGKDLVEFVLEGKNENTNMEAPEKAKVLDKQIFANTKSEPYLRKSNSEKAKSSSYLRKATAFTKKYGCPFCEFTTDSPKAISGHMKRHSSKYQPLNIAV
jgi:hypothetical protein